MNQNRTMLQQSETREEAGLHRTATYNIVHKHNKIYGNRKQQ